MRARLVHVYGKLTGGFLTRLQNVNAFDLPDGTGPRHTTFTQN